MQTLTQVVKACSDFLWGVPMLVMLFGTHLFLTVRLHFVQRHTFKAIRLSVTPVVLAYGRVRHCHEIRRVAAGGGIPNPQRKGSHGGRAHVHH